jgi:chromosome segregation ATPase
LRELLGKSAIDLVNNLGAATIFFSTKSFGTSKHIIQGGDIMEREKKEAQVKVEALEAQLKEWGVDLEKFRAKADKTKDKARAELEREVAALRAKLNEAQKKLEELKKAGDAASGDLKKGVENAWAELKKAFGSATAKFK